MHVQVQDDESFAEDVVMGLLRGPTRSRENPSLAMPVGCVGRGMLYKMRQSISQFYKTKIMGQLAPPALFLPFTSLISGTAGTIDD